jgi:CheY-like chemotaxis protein
MKILVIDDQELVILSLSKCLTDLGYEVKSANNVFNAIAAYDEFQPNLVIADINMPVLTSSIDTNQPFSVNDKASGLEIVKYIKQIKKHDTPVMILSGNNDEEVILKGFDLGVSDYMKKPLSLNEIGQELRD